MTNDRFRRRYQLVVAFIVTLTAVLGWMLVTMTYSVIDTSALDKLFEGQGGLWAGDYSRSLALNYLVTRLGAIGGIGVCLANGLYNLYFRQRKNVGFILAFFIGLAMIAMAASFIFVEAPGILNQPAEIIRQYRHYGNEYRDAARGVLESLQLAASLRLIVGLPLILTALGFMISNNWQRRKADRQAKQGEIN